MLTGYVMKQAKCLTLRVLLAFAGAAQAVFLAFFFAWVAAQEFGLLECAAQVWCANGNRFSDRHLDSINLTAEATTLH